MRILNNSEITCIAGGIESSVATMMGVGALAGAVVVGNMTSILSPLVTIMTTVGGTIGGGLVGTMIVPIPVIGTATGVMVGGLMGYYFGSTAAVAGSYLVGAVGGAAAAYAAVAK